jgi:hypothetical protein
MWILGILVPLALAWVANQPLLAQGPVAYYTFNQTISDSSGNGNDLSVRTGGLTWVADRFGHPNKAADFGHTTILRRSEFDEIHRVDGEPLSVSVWIRPNSFGGAQDIVAYRDDSLYAHVAINWILYEHHQPPGRIGFYGSQVYRSTYLPELDKWTHLVSTVDSLGINRVYANGALIYDSAYAYGITSARRLQLGGTSDVSGVAGELFDGSMDDVRIYTRALDNSEIQDLYQEGGWAGDTAVVGWWEFEEGAGLAAYDRSGNQHNGTLGGAISWAPGAVQLTGDQDFVAFGDSSFQMGQGSWVAVVRVESFPTAPVTCVILEKDQTGWHDDARLGLVEDGSGRIQFEIDQAGSSTTHRAISSSPIPLGEDVTLAASWGSEGMRLYVDGVLVATNAYTGGVVSAGASFALGSNFPAGTVAFRGFVKDLKVRNQQILGGGLLWQMPLFLSDNSCRDTVLVFGQSPLASDSIDGGLGEEDLPPPGISGVFDARFILPLVTNRSSIRDYRNDSLRDVRWTIRFQPSSCGYPMVFSWTPRSLPAGSFRLQDEFDDIAIVDVDMKVESTFTLTNTAISRLKIEYRTPRCVDVPVRPGWNLVSIPLTPTVRNIGSLFPGALSRAYSFSTSGGYVAQDTLRPGAGYWVKFGDYESYSICGLPPSDRKIAVVAQWNLVGPFETPVDSAMISTEPANIIESRYFGFDGNGYLPTDYLESGNAYWVRMREAGRLVLPQPPGVSLKSHNKPQ